MADPRFNDISCKLRNLARDLEAQAAAHRRTADALDHAMNAPERPPNPPQHLVALDAAAMQLIDLPAAEIRTAAPVVARAAGQQVLPVAIRAQRLRAQRKTREKRAKTLSLVALMANGMTLRQASEALGLSEATGRRMRDAWREKG